MDAILTISLLKTLYWKSKKGYIKVMLAKNPYVDEY